MENNQVSQSSNHSSLQSCTQPVDYSFVQPTFIHFQSFIRSFNHLGGGVASIKVDTSSMLVYEINKENELITKQNEQVAKDNERKAKQVCKSNNNNKQQQITTATQQQ